MSAGSVAPSAHLFLPDRRHRGREIPIVEAPNRSAKLIWTQIESPADRRAAGRAEVVVQFASVRTVSGIDSVLALKPGQIARKFSRRKNCPVPRRKADHAA